MSSLSGSTFDSISDLPDLTSNVGDAEMADVEITDEDVYENYGDAFMKITPGLVTLQEIAKCGCMCGSFYCLDCDLDGIPWLMGLFYCHESEMLFECPFSSNDQSLMLDDMPIHVQGT